MVRSFSKAWSLLWRRWQLRFVCNWLSVRGRITMIVLIIHCFSHLLLQNSLLNCISMLNSCDGWLCKIFGYHCHLTAVPIHITRLKLVFEVFLISSWWIRCEDIWLVDFVISTAILMLFRVHCEQSVFACVPCSLLIMRWRTVWMWGRLWILQCGRRILNYLLSLHGLIRFFQFLFSRFTFLLGYTWVSFRYLFGSLLVLRCFLNSLKIANWRGHSVVIDYKRGLFTAEYHFFASRMRLKILHIHLHISSHNVNWIRWSTGPKFNQAICASQMMIWLWIVNLIALGAKTAMMIGGVMWILA